MFQSASHRWLYSSKKAATKGKVHVSFTRTKYYNNSDIIALAGDRAVGNTLEQAVAFLPLLYAHTMLIDPSQTLQLSAVYSAFRAMYPFLFLSKKYVAVLISTIPGYCVQSYMAYNLTVWAAAHLL